MDIRNFFGNKQPKTPKTVAEPGKSTNEGKTRKRVVLSSSDGSDVEDPVPSKLQKRTSKTIDADGMRNKTRPKHADPMFTSSKHPHSSKARADNEDKKKHSKPLKKRVKSPNAGHSADADPEIVDLDGESSLSPPPKIHKGQKQAKPRDDKDRKVDRNTETTSKTTKREHGGAHGGAKEKPKPGSPKTKAPSLVNAISVTDFFKDAGSSQKKTTTVPKKDPEIHSQEDFNDMLKNADDEISVSSLSTTVTATPGIVEETPLFNGHSKHKKCPQKSEDVMLIEDSSKDDEKQCSENDKGSHHSPRLSERHSQSPKKTPHNGGGHRDDSELKQHRRKSPRKLDESVVEEAEFKPAKSPAAANYWKYRQREGPQALGSRDIPQPVPGALKDLTFVLSGVLDSIEKERAEDIIKSSGGRVTSAVSRKTSFLVIGREAGESKQSKAKDIGITILEEDEFFNLLESRFGPHGGKSKEEHKKPIEDVSKPKGKVETPITSPARKITTPVSTNKETKDKVTTPKPISQPKTIPSSSISVSGTVASSTVSSLSQTSTSSIATGTQNQNYRQLVDKYKPASSKQIIGQQGERSNMHKLSVWLKNWHKFHGGPATGKKPAAAKPWTKSEDGAIFKAALLSGAPGIGKTTTALMVCKELGLNVVEFNASDTRSKKLMENTVSELTDSRTMDMFFTGHATSSGCGSVDHVMIMDEIDGMSGNQDRGGMQEVIGFIKKSKIPIICICNDRNNQKIRSLANYCFDLRFHRPTVQQIRGAMMSVAFKEHLKITAPVMDEIIASASQDIRQVLNRLSLMAAQQDPSISSDKVATMMKKNVAFNPFEMARLMFADNEDTQSMSLNDRAEQFFFCDYGLMPLFCQENYLSATPKRQIKSASERMDVCAKSSEFISNGDLCEKKIRNTGAWSLLPHQAFFSVVQPSMVSKGYLQGMVGFPSWFGKYSKTNRISRLLQQLQIHMSLKTSSNRSSLNTDYLPLLRKKIVSALMSEDLQGAIDICSEYDLTRDDVDAVMEVSEMKEPTSFSKIPTQVKSAFTRTFNKTAHALPYATGTEAGGKKRKSPRVAASTANDEHVIDEEGNDVYKAATTAEEEDDAGDDEDEDYVPEAKKPKPSKKTTALAKEKKTKKTSAKEK